MTRFAIVPVFALLSIACTGQARHDNDTTSVAPASAASKDTVMAGQKSSIAVTSTAFAEGSAIPAHYTCEGDESSPPLAWTGAPAATKSFALIVEDPDAPDPAKPQRIWVHWIVYDIPASVTSLAENASKLGLPKGALRGKNDSGKLFYGGPCPPLGRHRYFFRLYALDTGFAELSSPTKKDLLQAMKDHILAEGELMGTYQKTS